MKKKRGPFTRQDFEASIREISAAGEQAPVPGKKLSLYPLTLEEAVEAVVQVPPPPKKAPRAKHPAGGGHVTKPGAR